jgi:hypothetical protein
MGVQTHAIFHVSLMIVIKLQLYQNVLAYDRYKTATLSKHFGTRERFC